MIPALFASSFAFAPLQFGEALAMTFAVSILMASHFAALAELLGARG